MANLKLFFWVLILVSASEILALYIVKKNLLANAVKRNVVSSIRNPIQNLIFKFSIIIFALCLAPTIYGLVYFLLGGSMEEFVLFMAITLLSFRIFRPKLEDLKKFEGQRPQGL